MKKILWITADYLVDVDLPIVSALKDKYEISWFVSRGKSSSISYDKLIKNYNIDSKFSYNNLIIKRRIRNPFIFFEFLKLVLFIKRQKADIYYINMYGMPFFLPLLRLFINVDKIVLAVHNVSTPKGASSYRFTDLYTRLNLYLFKNIHVYSVGQKKILESRNLNKNILLAPLMLKNFGLSTKMPFNIITFLSFGYIRDYKRLDLLIDASQLAYEETKILFKVRIAGSCLDWKEKYQPLIKYPFLFDLRIYSIPNEDIPDLFSTSHYFVVSYQDIAQSGALNVGLNYNLPIIASDIEGFKEFVIDKQTGYLFKNCSVESLKSILVYILSNHHKIYPQLKNEGEKFVNAKFSGDSIVKKYVEYLNAL